ncbi:T9SS type A sorting domain-containing protein [bacterium SCSIO 12643]|nr:T9SS type A sorting domain-containing protein [bacterium SCSIO 12643]
MQNIILTSIIVFFSSTASYAQKLIWSSEFGGTNSNGAIVSYELSNGQIETPISLNGSPMYGINILYDYGSNGLDNTAGMIVGNDSNYYGINCFGTGTRLEGSLNKESGGRGFFYRYEKATGKVKVLHSFVGNQEWDSDLIIPSDGFGNDLSVPVYNVLETSPGIFYGLATGGGTSGNGGVWKYDMNTQTYSVIGSFNDTANDVGFNPVTALIQGDGNNIYGLNQSKHGLSNQGFLFKIDTSTDQLSFVAALNAAGWVMAHPHGQMLYNSPTNTIYGTKDQFDGSSNWGGGVWSYNLTTSTQINEWTILFSQISTLGSLATGIIQANDGFMYVTTRDGGAHGAGTIIKYTPSGGTYVKVYDFPAGFSLASGYGMIAVGSKIYGTCSWNLTDEQIWSYDTFTGIYQAVLQGNETDPLHPGTLLDYGIAADDGKIIGRTKYASAHGAGAIFSHDVSTGTNTILHDCGSRNGRHIIGEMTQISDSTFVGYIAKGGPINKFNPADSTIQYESGALALFNILSGEIKYLDNPFVVFPEDEFVQRQTMNRPMLGSNGKLYYSVYSWTGFNADNRVLEHDLNTAATTAFALPIATELDITPGLLDLPGGRLLAAYQNTLHLYDYINGNMISTDTSTHDWKKYGHMNHNLVLGSNGKIYGMTQPSTLGSSPGDNVGVIYSLDTTTFTFTVEHQFDSLVRNVNAGLVEYNGKLYGSTNFLGTNNQGYLFSFDMASGTFATEHSFNKATDGGGFNARWTLFNNKLYSTARTGGQNGYGTLVEFDPSSSSFTTLSHLTMDNGRSFRGTPFLWDDTFLSIVENGKLEPLKIYPNPAKTVLYIEGDKMETIEIYDATGKLILSPLNSNTIDIHSLPKGIYIIVAQQAKKSFSAKFIKE